MPVEHRANRALRRGGTPLELKEKNIIILGERDGIQAPAIAECLEAAGAVPVLVQTQCFV
jgi:betaine reductase